MRILSGIQPSGPLHIGNYFGALRQFIDLQNGNDAYYFVADYHALTSVRDARQLREYTFDVFVSMLVTGPRPGQGDLVRSVGRAGNDRAGMAALERDAHGLAGKMRELQGQDSAGLCRPSTGFLRTRFCRRPTSCSTTPTWCPSGRTRSSTWKSRATSPSGSTGFSAAGTTSSGCPSRIFSRLWPWSPAWTARRCPRATTTRSRSSTTRRRSRRRSRRSSPTARRSRHPRTPTPARSSTCYRLFASPADLAEVERRYREGGIGYGEVKSRLADAMIARFSDARERRADWLAHPERVAEVRAAGGRASPGRPPASSSTGLGPPAGSADGSRSGGLVAAYSLIKPDCVWR